MKNVLAEILSKQDSKERMLAALLDPDKFDLTCSAAYFQGLPDTVTHIFVGGSTVANGETDKLLQKIKAFTNLPIVLFPGDASQVSSQADALLFLSLLSGRNPEYLIGQQIKAVPSLQHSSLEIIPTAYLLIDGGKETAVQQVTQTPPLPQDNPEAIVHTALAGQYSGNKLIYLEAGSGAKLPVGSEIIRQVKSAVNIPLVVGGGIRTEEQLLTAYQAGADMVVVGTAFERKEFVR